MFVYVFHYFSVHTLKSRNQRVDISNMLRSESSGRSSNGTTWIFDWIWFCFIYSRSLCRCRSKPSNGFEGTLIDFWFTEVEPTDVKYRVRVCSQFRLIWSDKKANSHQKAPSMDLLNDATKMAHPDIKLANKSWRHIFVLSLSNGEFIKINGLLLPAGGAEECCWCSFGIYKHVPVQRLRFTSFAHPWPPFFGSVN